MNAGRAALIYGACPARSYPRIMKNPRRNLHLFIRQRHAHIFLDKRRIVRPRNIEGHRSRKSHVRRNDDFFYRQSSGIFQSVICKEERFARLDKFQT